ncbi:hypothetical protein [Alsobacter sp. R-9]
MPLAVIGGRGFMPAVIEADSDASLLSALAGMPFAPAEAKASVAGARWWLSHLPYPSGWYATRDDLRATLARRRLPDRDDLPLAPPAEPVGGGEVADTSALVATEVSAAAR